MKRLLLGVLGIFVFTAALAVQPAVESTSFAVAVEAAQDPSTITVYVTRTGEKYHRDGGRYLSRSRIPSSLKDAQSRGFGPCSVCKPPIR